MEVYGKTFTGLGPKVMQEGNVQIMTSCSGFILCTFHAVERLNTLKGLKSASFVQRTYSTLNLHGYTIEIYFIARNKKTFSHIEFKK